MSRAPDARVCETFIPQVSGLVQCLVPCPVSPLVSCLVDTCGVVHFGFSVLLATRGVGRSVASRRWFAGFSAFVSQAPFGLT